MIIVFKPEATEKEINHVIEKLKELGLKPDVSRGEERVVIGAIGNERVLETHPVSIFPGVEKVVPILSPFKRVSREYKKENSTVKVAEGVEIGGKRIHIMAGPCAVESKDLLIDIAREVKKGGATVMRGGAYKPRTSPYSFQGLEEEGLKFLAEARKVTGLPIVTEVVDARDVSLVAKYADILQIGARNMQNFRLLSEAGSQDKPVLLKRGLSATIKEFLLSAEYIMAAGNPNVILCERGIRTFETATRNTLDLSAVPVIKGMSHLPIIVDPSHATGRWELVAPMARAGVAAGADGIMMEVHINPEAALCDGEESIKPHKFRALMEELKKIAEAIGREI